MQIFLGSFSFLTLLALRASSTATVQPRRLVAKLIHRDSISSPSYRPNDTITDRAKRMIESSRARLAYISKISDLGPDEIIQTYLVPPSSTAVYYVSFSIGEPPIQQFAVMDTGSNILWVKCLPCTACQEKTQVFNPSKSSTYNIIPCHSFLCDHHDKCNPLNQCTYNVKYVKGPSSTGILSTEQLTFENEEHEEVVDNVLFGCGHEINGNFIDEDFCGVFGLGAFRKNSMVYQLGSKFSYCIGSFLVPDYSYSRLTLGDGAYLGGYSTPFNILSGHYYLTMEGISLDGKRLDIDPIIFRNEGPQKGVIIDSGTSLIYVATRAYKILGKTIMDLLDGELTRVDVPSMPLCYKGVVETDLRGFPVITFHFADGADLVLEFPSSFIQFSTNKVCSTFIPSDIGNKINENLTVIGIMAQQNYNVGYDLNSRKLFLENIDCELV